MDSIECPSCKNEVVPDRRKLPGSMDAKGRVGSALLAFGNFCPVVGCGFRLDDAIAAMQAEPKAEFLPEEREERPAKQEPKKVVSIRPAKESEDLFVRIRREHEDAIREEGELTSRLKDVVKRREKLDRLVLAMETIQSPIAAE